jgi:hypothetical protein
MGSLLDVKSGIGKSRDAIRPRREGNVRMIDA